MSRPTDDDLIAAWREQPAPLLPLLHAFHDRDGFVSDAAIRAIARGLKLPLADLFGTVTFYHHFARTSRAASASRGCATDRSAGCAATQGLLSTALPGRDADAVRGSLRRTDSRCFRGTPCSIGTQPRTRWPKSPHRCRPPIRGRAPSACLPRSASPAARLSTGTGGPAATIALEKAANKIGRGRSVLRDDRGERTGRTRRRGLPDRPQVASGRRGRGQPRSRSSATPTRVSPAASRTAC